MKGTFYLNSAEIIINLDGETWSQGETIKGNILINLKEQLMHKQLFLSFGWANNKKILAKDKKSFTLLKRLTFNLETKKSTDETFELKIPQNGPIQESTASPYLFIHFNEDDFLTGNALNLPIMLNKSTEYYIEMMKTFYKFTPKVYKNKKGKIDIKLIPPSTRELASVDQLNIIAEPKDEGLNIEHQFKVQKLEYGQGAVQAQKKIIKINRLIKNEDIFQYGDSINQEKLKPIIEDVLSQVKSKLLSP